MAAGTSERSFPDPSDTQPTNGSPTANVAGRPPCSSLLLLTSRWVPSSCPTVALPLLKENCPRPPFSSFSSGKSLVGVKVGNRKPENLQITAFPPPLAWILSPLGLFVSPAGEVRPRGCRTSPLARPNAARPPQGESADPSHRRSYRPALGPTGRGPAGAPLRA
jgi:hypothetical protein